MLHNNPRTALLTSILPIFALLAGCGKKVVSYYEVPSEKPAAASIAPRMPATARLHWNKPSVWQERPGSAMRLASYAFDAEDGSTADISVTMFPDAAGGLLANINRWRGQVGLAPVGEEDLDSTASRTQIAGLPAWRVDLLGTPADGVPTRIIAAIIPAGGNSWFFKMMGPDPVVSSQQNAFEEMIASIHAVAPDDAAHTHEPAPAADDPHANVPGAPPLTAANAGNMDPSAVPPPPATGPIGYDVPPGWEEKPAGGFRVASFSIPGPSGQSADVSVITLSGPAGGELANVNRWRTQVGLAPISAAELESSATTMTTPAGTFRVFDLDGSSGKRILAAILPSGERTWFVKMVGDSAQLETQKDAFAAFLRSLRLQP